MFGKLQGLVDYVGNNFVILMSGGIGFKIMLAINVLSMQSVGKEAIFWIETIVREDSINLVGFNNLSEQELFLKLTMVTGIGTKVALAILGSFKTDILRTAIATGDVKTLTAVPGVGKKVAERIIVELKGKIDFSEHSEGSNNHYDDTISALEALGYRRSDVVEMVQKLVKENPDDSVQSLIKKALKQL